MTARKIRQLEYYYAMVRDRPGEAYRLLAGLGAAGVNLMAFNAVPAGLELTQVVLFPDDPELLAKVAQDRDLELNGPHHALFIQGDDRLGALAEIHSVLFEAGVNVAASSGVADGQGGYGYVIYLRAEDVAAAAKALEL